MNKLAIALASLSLWLGCARKRDGGDDVLKSMNEYRDKVCACVDAACVRDASKAWTAQVKANPPAEKYARSKGVYAEWIEACKGGAPAQSDFGGHAGALTEMVLLGCIAQRTGGKRLYDGERITNNDQANALITKPYREGWDFGM